MVANLSSCLRSRVRHLLGTIILNKHNFVAGYVFYIVFKQHFKSLSLTLSLDYSSWGTVFVKSIWSTDYYRRDIHSRTRLVWQRKLDKRGVESLIWLCSHLILKWKSYTWDVNESSRTFPLCLIIFGQRYNDAPPLGTFLQGQVLNNNGLRCQSACLQNAYYFRSAV